MEIWDITIYCDNGPVYSILGDEDALKAELAAWQSYQNRAVQGAQEAQASFSDGFVDTEGYEVRMIEGTTHDIGRYPVTLAYRFSEVQGMVVMRVR